MINNNALGKIFEFTPSPGLILKPDAPKFTIAEVNNAYLALTNFTKDQLIGKGYFEVFPDNVGIGMPGLQKVVDEKKPFKNATQQYELKIPGTDTYEYKSFDVINTPVFDDNGAIEYIIRTVIDVTTYLATKRNEEESRNQFQSLIQTVEGIVWEADVATLEFNFVSDNVKSVLGYTPEEWMSVPNFWENHIYPEDREQAINYCHVQTQECRNHTFDYRMIKANGDLVWIKDIVTVIVEKGKPKLLRGLMVDITSTKRLTDLDRLEKQVLELNAQKQIPLAKILTVYLEGIERLFPQMNCSLLRVKDDKLYGWASPSLPQTYTNILEGLAIGNMVGSCGTAAWLKERVIVSDIATDPIWGNYKDLALPYGLKACWSCPIINSSGIVVAVFGIYYKEVKTPREEELQVIERSAAILKVILENRQNYELAQETTMLMEQGQELANFGNWRWDIVNNVVKWSDTLYTIYGLNRASFKATFEGYQELLHPDDRQMVYTHIQNVLQTKQDVVFEERIIRPNGEVRYLRSWGRLKTDDEGNPIKMIGACLDITESKLAETKLKQLHNELEDHLNVLELSEKNYSDLFHLSPLPMWVFDKETLKFLNVNSAAINHYGYSLKEFLSMTIRDIRPDEENDKLDDAIISSQHPGSYNSGVFKHKKKNGQIILVNIQSTFIQFNGKSTRLVLANDITEQLNHTAAIELQNKRLQDIAWIQSHVVRAPLARIMGLIELFECYKSTDIDKPDLLNNIMRSAKELDTIIKEISSKTEEVWQNHSLPN
ncbi:PAS domain S-box protein [Inquilinus sp. KBS0705]|nr:PAS domain S-box protein [Inquilinus sp. KBS0705]